jgi:iron-sulfur cluster repair protein YtfE (RIC family)
MEKTSKVDLLNQLVFLVELQSKVWRYHPDNPNAINVKEEYTSLQEEIDSLEKELSDS